MTTKRYSVKSPGRGGARPGAGRKPGSTTKVRLEDLLRDVEQATTMPFTQRVALNYALAISREDWGRVENYDKAFLNKMVADKLEVEQTDPEDHLERRRQAFAEALEQLVENHSQGK